MIKFYVVSGTLRSMVLAKGLQSAVRSALDTHGGNQTLDNRWIYLDERGFREEDAKYKVPVEQALAEAGYIFEDDGPSDSSLSAED